MEKNIKNRSESYRKQIEIPEIVLPIIISIVSTIIIAAPYIFRSLKLAKVEEFYFGIIPLMFWSSQKKQGIEQIWNGDLSLGTPWPTPQLMNNSPLSFLIQHLDVYTALTTFVFMQVSIQGLCAWLLCRELKLSRKAKTLTTITILLAPPIEYLLTSDALPVYFNWTLLPSFILVTLKFSNANKPIDKILWGNVSSLLLYYGISNGHLGVLITYLLVVPIIIFNSKQKITKKINGILILCLLSLLLNINKIFSYLHEYRMYGENIPRIHDSHSSNIVFSAWALFLKPIPLINPFDKSIIEFIDFFGSMNSVVRVLSFGSPIVIYVLICGILESKKKSVKYLSMKDKELVNTFWLISGICTLLSYLPTEIYGDFVSANWTFKDPVIVCGALLFGYYIDRFNLHKRFLLIIIHVTCLVTSSLILTLGPTVYSILNSKQTYHTPKQIAETVNPSSSAEAIRILKEDNSCTNQTCKQMKSRVIYTGAALDLLYSEKLVLAGLLPNSLLIQGFADVSASLKGISLDSIHPSQRKFYGMISSESFDNYVYQSGKSDWVLNNAALRNILGIKYIIAKRTDEFNSLGLTKIGEFKSDNSLIDDMVIMKNIQPSIQLFNFRSKNPYYLVSTESCEDKKYLTCLNVEDLYSEIDKTNVTGVEKIANVMALKIKPSNEDSTLIFTEMWRPQWKSNVGKTFNFYGLIGINVPPNNDTVLINYLPNLGPMNIQFLKTLILIDVLLLILLLMLKYRIITYDWHQIGKRSRNN